MKTTPWFVAGKQNPVRVGAYECGDGSYKYWNGDLWGFYEKNPKRAEQSKVTKKDSASFQRNFQWRGLLKESK